MGPGIRNTFIPPPERKPILPYITTFYRVLYDNRLWDCWHSDPVANSSHHHPPCQWIDRWDKHDKQSKKALEENYPLECIEGGRKVMFTARARLVFLADPNKFTPEFIREHWDSTEVYEVGQLNGVCAFASAQACLDWVASDSIKKNLAHEYRYVVFDGTYVSEAPEAAGVVAQVVKKIGDPMPLKEFGNMRDFLGFLHDCNGPQLGALGEYVFEAKMKELGHEVVPARANGGDFFVDDKLVDVKTSMKGPLRSPHIDKDDGATNIYMSLNETGAVIKLLDRLVSVDCGTVRRIFEHKNLNAGTKSHQRVPEAKAKQKQVVERLKRRYPTIKFVRRAWDHTQRRMCGGDWGPEAFKIQPNKNYQGAILCFFRDGSTRFQFFLAYRLDEMDSIDWTMDSPNKIDVTFSLSKFPTHLRFATLRAALDHVLKRNG